MTTSLKLSMDQEIRFNLFHETFSLEGHIFIVGIFYPLDADQALTSAAALNS